MGIKISDTLCKIQLHSPLSLWDSPQAPVPGHSSPSFLWMFPGVLATHSMAAAALQNQGLPLGKAKRKKKKWEIHPCAVTSPHFDSCPQFAYTCFQSPQVVFSFFFFKNLRKVYYPGDIWIVKIRSRLTEQSRGELLGPWWLQKGLGKSWKICLKLSFVLCAVFSHYRWRGWGIWGLNFCAMSVPRYPNLL